jgi:hypothetical protein
MFRYLFIVLAIYANELNAQEVKLRNDDLQKTARFHQTYVKENGKYYGAGPVVDGNNLAILFRTAKFDKRNRQFFLSGTVFLIIPADEARIDGVEIFIATPLNNKLTGVRSLGKTNDGTLNKSLLGDFTIQFRLEKGERLYFEGGNVTYLMEYDLHKLKIK